MVVIGPTVIHSTPDEFESVCGYALNYTAVGYKRLTWQMVDQDVAYLRPYQVYNILAKRDLLSRRRRVSDTLKRPPGPDHPGLGVCAPERI